MLCQAEQDGTPAPGHAHEHCLACPSLGGAGAPATFAALAFPTPARAAHRPGTGQGIQDTSGRAAYASRAPPGTAG